MFAPRANAPPKIIINNYLGGAGGALVAVFFKPLILKQRSFINKFDIATMCNGLIVGLVSVTASCDRTEPWAGLVIGGVGACFYTFGCWVMEKTLIDDPVEAFPLHMGGGTWGLIAVGIFDNQ
jgi:Amt family ammonium transporter